MSLVWAVPALVLLFGSAAVVALLRGTAESARQLGSEVARFGELHSALVRLRNEVEHGARELRGADDRDR